MVTSKDAVIVLRVLASLLLAGAAWFVFRAPSTTESTQVGPETCPSGYTLYFAGCSSPGEAYATATPGATATLTFACSTVWANWIAKAPYTADGTTYADLAGTWTPDDKIYDDPYPTASASCVNADHGRVHLFWTLVVLAGLVLIGSEAVRRSPPTDRRWNVESDVSR